MGTFADNLDRLKVATVTGHLPPDLGRSLLEVLIEAAPVAERLAARNGLLRQAAGLVSGSRWSKARRLEKEIAALSGPRLRTRGARPDEVGDLVARALEVAPAPGTMRQLLTILG